MKNLRDLYGNQEQYFDEVSILSVGNHGAGSYSLPPGDMWTDYEYVEFIASYPSGSGGESSIGMTVVSKELISTKPTSFVARITSYNSGDVRVDIVATGVDTFTISTPVGSIVVGQIKAYKKKYATRNLSKVVSVNGGADIASNSRYEIDIATMLGSEYLNRDLIVEVEIYNNTGTGTAGWGNPGWHTYYTTANGAYGVRAGTLENKIIVQSGEDGVLNVSWYSGSVFGNTVISTSAPCRIKVWKVDEYLPATKSSGDITTIWTGSVVNGVTVDWSGTSYTLSQFDAIMVEGTVNGSTKGVYTVIPPSKLLSNSPVDTIIGEQSASGSWSRLDIRNFTETSMDAGTSNNSYLAGYLTGIYGINYN